MKLFSVSIVTILFIVASASIEEIADIESLLTERQLSLQAKVDLLIDKVIELCNTTKHLEREVNKHELRISWNSYRIGEIDTQVNSSASFEIPLGAIIPWVPRPDTAAIFASQLPDNFQLCDGSAIVKGPWKGYNTPDLTNVFLRGGHTNNYLQYQPDSIQDHLHIDKLHKHLDLGHKHDDAGHLHSDAGHAHADAGHKHPDTKHKHTDSGHDHGTGGHKHRYRKGFYALNQVEMLEDESPTTGYKLKPRKEIQGNGKNIL